MVCKVIKHENKKYFTFYKFDEIKINSNLFLWLKRSNRMIPVRCIERPENIPFYEMGPNDKFVFKTLSGEIITIAKYGDYSKELRYVSFENGKRSAEPVVFVSGDERINRYGKNGFLNGMSQHQREILRKMNIDQEYSPACLGTSNPVMVRLMNRGAVRASSIKMDERGKRIQAYVKV